MQSFIRDDTGEINNFEFPTNIKQVGNIEERLKIYIEDYAYMYIQQYANSESDKEKIAALIGKFFIKEGQPVLIISGVIQAKFSKQSNGMETFSEDDWEYIYNQKDIFFPSLELVGWLHVQPGYGIFLNSADLSYHMEKFNKDFQVLFIMDPIEKMDAFFLWNEFQDDLRIAAGYFIYYDKNEEMQEYMLENRVVKLRPPKEESKIEEKEEVLITYRKHDRIKKNKEIHLRKMTNMLTSLSAVLFLISFIMGAGLIQNGDRISKLEKEITSINTAYRNIVAGIKSDNITPVFAGTDIPADGSLVDEDDIVVLAEEDATTDTVTSIESENEIVIEPEKEIVIEPEPETSKIEVVPAPAPAPVETVESTIPDTYVVQDGDNLSYISVRFYGTDKMMAKIMEVNNITDPNTIFAGKKIKLPK